ncbi:MAG: amidohydrolase family protein [Acetobacteraceae bacterium]
MTNPILGVRHTAPAAPTPAGACDCHTHVFGPAADYPFAPNRAYTPGEAGVDALLALQAALGFDRVVIVQPSTYGTDNRCTLDAVRQLGDRARAVAVIRPDLPAAELAALHAQGVRGVRINLETAGQRDPAVAGQMLHAAAEHVAPLGWHVQVYTNLGVLAALESELQTLPVPLVVDHFGRTMAAAGTRQHGFDTLLGLVQSGRAYVKLSAAHRIAARPDDAAPIAAALIAANPARMLWGTDWPHPGGKRHATPEFDTIEPFDPVDDGAAVNRLRRWAGDEATLGAILVDNPARLYRFGEG